MYKKIILMVMLFTITLNKHKKRKLIEDYDEPFVNLN